MNKIMRSQQLLQQSKLSEMILRVSSKKPETFMHLHVPYYDNDRACWLHSLVVFRVDSRRVSVKVQLTQLNM